MGAPTIERGRRCENCRHFTNGEMAIQHYKIKRNEELNAQAKQIFERGGPVPVGLTGQRLGDMEHSHKVGADATTRDFRGLDARMQALGINYEFGDTLMRNGQLGLCLISASPGDFVHKDYFCGAKYDPKVKVDDAHKHDETAEEARDRLGLKE